ncbi:MAG TPA: alpha/beta hydrolase [Pseudonocardiaceae bacterium]|nr:alpha/beta hydrolase [Pseudonocardiaceae bacterium]
MTTRHPTRRTRTRLGIAGLLALTLTLAATLLMPSGLSSASSSHNGGPKPTIVLVHGAFADASGWAGVEQRLQKRGYTVIAPANPLRGVAGDSAYISSVLATISGPIVLVGHSYGGEVITNAATGNPTVKALVYIAAFAPDEGETSGLLATKFPGSELTPANLVFRPYPVAGGTTGTDGYINPTVFHDVFCADIPANTAATMGASQRPAELATLSEPSGIPAWKTIPSWYLVANQDHAIPAAAERFMAHRMAAHTVEINSSHVAMISHPNAVTDLILAAAHNH